MGGMKDNEGNSKKDHTGHLEEEGGLLGSDCSSKFGASGPKDEICGSHDYLSRPSKALSTNMNIGDAKHVHGPHEGDGHQYPSVTSYERHSQENEKQTNMQTTANPTGAFSNLGQLRNRPPTSYLNPPYLCEVGHCNSASRLSVHPNTVYTENHQQNGSESAWRSTHQTDISNSFYADRELLYPHPWSTFETNISQHSHLNHHPQRFIPVDPFSATYEHMNHYMQYDPATSTPWINWTPNQPRS